MSEPQQQFDDINNAPAESETKVKSKANTNEENDGLQTLIRIISCLPCFPKYTEKPETPNMDEIKSVFDRFKSKPDETDTTVVERTNTQDLCRWSENVVKFLPSVADSQEAGAKDIVTHFKTIKRFYGAFENAGFDVPESLQFLFNSVQIYECVMAVSFVAFEQHPETVTSINDQLTGAVSEIEGYNTQGCLALTLCGAAILSRYNLILGAIDNLLGKMGIVKVAEFIADIIEVFCKFLNINPQDFTNLTAISEAIQDIIGKVSSALRSVFGDDIPKLERKKRWGPLAISERIKNKLAKFENQAPIVQRTVTTFERLFNAIEKIDDNFEMLKVTQQQQRASPSDGEISNEDDMTKEESTPLLAAQISEKQEVNIEEIKSIGRLFQHLETVMSYGILLFKNEDDVLEPLLGHVDECVRILEKFNVLHPLYKILCGKNFLSKLKAEVKKIVKLLDNSKLKFNSPSSFLKEFNKNYPNLLYILCESFVTDKVKKKIEFLPDGIENAINNALDGTLSKFKNKFKL